MSSEPTTSGTVVLGYLHAHSVATIFAESVFATYNRERVLGTHRLGTMLAVVAGAMGLDAARDDLVRQFLAQTDAQWLWMLDTDLGFAPESLDTLLSVAEEHDLDIVSGLYFGRWDGQRESNGKMSFEVRPLVYRWHDDEQAFQQLTSESDVPVNTLMTVDGAGGGCLLIRRSIIERVLEKWDTCFDLIPVNRPSQTGRQERLSEDLSFCLRVRNLGGTIAVHTGVRLAHQKPDWI